MICENSSNVSPPRGSPVLSGVKLREMMFAEPGTNGPKFLPPPRYVAGLILFGWPKNGFPPGANWLFPGPGLWQSLQPPTAVTRELPSPTMARLLPVRFNGTGAILIPSSILASSPPEPSSFKSSALTRGEFASTTARAITATDIPTPTSFRFSGDILLPPFLLFFRWVETLHISKRQALLPTRRLGVVQEDRRRPGRDHEDTCVIGLGRRSLLIAQVLTSLPRARGRKGVSERAIESESLTPPGLCQGRPAKSATHRTSQSRRLVEDFGQGASAG